MKHPLPESPFPQVHFSHAEFLDFRRQALTLVDECLEEYDEYADTNQYTVNKRKWKEIKGLENVTVYKRMTKEEARMARTPLSSTVSSARESSSSSSSSSGKSYVSNFEWQTPRLIAVGKVVGTLDDVMYGIVTPDKEAMRVNTTYLEDEYIDSRVLCSMQCPTESKPFQFLGIKWAVRSQGSIIKPRDIVYLECTGIKRRSNGERFGYWVQHSVDIPQYDELKTLGIVRSRQSWVSVFRETSNGSVELYMRMFIDAGGNVSDRLAIQAAANSLLTIWKVSSCAHNKKLAWLMRDSSSKRSPQVVAKAKAERVKHCKLCTKSVSTFGTLTTCELCLSKICSRCLTMRKLSYMRATGQIFTVPTSFCKNCITRGAKTSSADVSVLEYVPDAPEREPEIIETSEIFSSRRGVRDSTKSAPPGSSSFVSTPLSASTTPLSHASSLPATLVTDSLYDSGRGGTTIYIEDPLLESSRIVKAPRVPSGGDQAHAMAAAGHVPQYVGYSPHYQSPSSMARYEEPLRPEDHRRMLWEQMAQLRIQAEEAYWQTKRNGLVMHDGVSSP